MPKSYTILTVTIYRILMCYIMIIIITEYVSSAYSYHLCSSYEVQILQQAVFRWRNGKPRIKFNVGVWNLTLSTHERHNPVIIQYSITQGQAVWVCWWKDLLFVFRASLKASMALECSNHSSYRIMEYNSQIMGYPK